MSHYEERLEQDENLIRKRVKALSIHTRDALQNALHSVATGNRNLAYATILGDARINREMRDIDGLCHRFIARHLPSAGHLRLMSAIMRTIMQLERIGDYAVTISREGVQLSAPPDGPIQRELELMENQATRMLGRSMDAFNEGNVEAALATMDLGETLEGTMDQLYTDLISTTESAKIKDLLALFVIFNLVKRVTDQAKNICEETLFAVNGQTKAERVHNVLFVDEDNASLSQMAQAIASGGYPGIAHFASAGRTPAEHVDQGIASFMGEHGFDLSGAQPVALDASHDALSPYFVIISLQGPMSGYATDIPFHTSVLEWDVGAPPEGPVNEQTSRRYEELYREISLQVRDLVDVLRGREGA